MRCPSPIHYALIAASFFLVTEISVSTTYAADKPASKQAKKPTASADSGARSALAAGSVEDSLQTCLARIPKDATSGQRMIAEQSCRRDEQDRKPFQATGSR